MDSQQITSREVYDALKRQYPADTILIRTDEGYECFDGDAAKMARICHLDKGPDGGSLRFAHALLDDYKALLVAAGCMILEAEIA